MKRWVWMVVVCGLLALDATPALRAAPPPADARVEAVMLVAEDDPVGLPPRPVTAPLPSAGIGGLALLSLMMLRRWFRHRL